jgi:hypothetical protein
MQFIILTHHGFILLVSVLIFNYVVDHFCSLLRLSIHAMADGAPLEEEGFSFVESEPLLQFDLPLRDNTSAVAESLGLPLGGTSMVVETYASISSVSVRQSWQLNNTALKFIRDTNETNEKPYDRARGSDNV